MWTSENDSNTLQVDAYFFFLDKGGKKISVFKYIRIRMDATCYYRRIEHTNSDEPYVIP